MTSDNPHKLVVIRGPDLGREFELYPGVSFIGRDPGNPIAIPGTGVSRRHAQVTVQGDVVTLQDLNSSNGTFVNGQRISAPHILTSGDAIKLGQSVEMRYTALVQAAPEATVVEVDEGLPMAPSPSEATVVRPEQPPPAPSRPSPAPPRPPVGVPSGTAQTMLGDVADMGGPQTPPNLVVEQAGGRSQTFILVGNQYTIGRADDNDIRVDSKIVSRYHAQLEKTPQGYRLVQLPNVGNQIYVQGRPLPGAYDLVHGDVLRIGGIDPGTMVTLRYSSPATAVDRLAAVDITFGERTVLQIGRDASNDIRLDVPHISRYHAQIERVGTRYRVRDLRSSNGTFVNGERIKGEVWLKPDDQVRIGPYRFVLGEDRLAQYDESTGLQVDALGLNKWVRKNLNILKNISLAFQPREFIVVVGQSGGGKSTLVDAIAGYRPATHGQVLVNGINVYQNFDAIRNEIGYVPQRDIIHMELTVFQALDYAAQLRMPPDTSKQERHKRVMEVLEDLDLAHRKDVQISGLSGGQQKRVSIGVELLTKPGLFFLDEPTSGLDPGTETALMQLMRRMADQGRTIVLITHATKNVMLADKVVFLARGGYLTWFGPPDEALEYFNQYRSEREQRAGEMEFDQIYAILDDPGKGAQNDWSERYMQHPAYQKYIVEPLQKQARSQQTGPARQARPARRVRPRTVSALRQFAILSSRNLKILLRDRFSLALMLAAAPIVGLLDFVVAALLGRDAYDPVDGFIGNAFMTLFLLALYAIMVGALAQMREIVKEQEIYKRERLVNLKIMPYALSKVWVAALLSLYQAGAYVIMRYIAFDMPPGIVEFVFIYITLVLATMGGMMLGLFSSALAPNANSAPMIVILLLLPQIVLGGALIPLPGPGLIISAFTVTRWPFENLMAITGVGSDVAGDACWQLPEEQRAQLSLEERSALCKCMGVNLFDVESCAFPGVIQYYDPAVDATPPVEPTEPVIPPKPELALPPQPTEPADQSDTIAMAEYLEKLREWQAAVEQIQTGFEAEVAAYEAQVALIQAQYQADVNAYAEELQAYEVGRNAAVGKAEGLVAEFLKNFGWTFVNKENLMDYGFKLVTRWGAQLFISLLLFVAILIIQKRKDVV